MILPLMTEVPRGDFGLLPPWYAEAVAVLCWSEAAFALAPPDDYRFALFADDLQNAAVLLCRGRVSPPTAWAALCARLPAAAELAWNVPERKKTAAAVPERARPVQVAWQPDFQVEAGVPRCRHGVVRRIPAGTAKRTGKPYLAFWACPNRVCRIPDSAFDLAGAPGATEAGPAALGWRLPTETPPESSRRAEVGGK